MAILYRVCVCVWVANKVKLLLGIPRDPDLAQYLTQMEEENENNEDEKPKVWTCGLLFSCVGGVWNMKVGVGAQVQSEGCGWRWS